MSAAYLLSVTLNTRPQDGLNVVLFFGQRLEVVLVVETRTVGLNLKTYIYSRGKLLSP